MHDGSHAQRVKSRTLRQRPDAVSQLSIVQSTPSLHCESIVHRMGGVVLPSLPLDPPSRGGCVTLPSRPTEPPSSMGWIVSSEHDASAHAATKLIAVRVKQERRFGMTGILQQPSVYPQYKPSSAVER
jgi:hypothetical protein